MTTRGPSDTFCWRQLTQRTLHQQRNPYLYRRPYQLEYLQPNDYHAFNAMENQFTSFSWFAWEPSCGESSVACKASVPWRRAFSVFWPRANWSKSKKIDERGGGGTTSIQSARGLNAAKARSTSKLATKAKSSVLHVTTRVVRVLFPKYNLQKMIERKTTKDKTSLENLF